jgi:hypothetical protein
LEENNPVMFELRDDEPAIPQLGVNWRICASWTESSAGCLLWSRLV